MQRGKLDLFITYEDFSESNVCIKYNKDIAAEYLGYLKAMSEDFGLDMMSASRRSRDIQRYFSMEEQTVDEEEIWKGLLKAIQGAAEGLVQTRIQEGQNLAVDLMGKLDGMLEHVAFIEERSPQIIDEYRKKLEERVHELLGDASVDESRLLTEITILQIKCAWMRSLSGFAAILKP